MIAARRTLAEAEGQYRRTGAELHGFLSERTGFLPRDPPELALPDSHHAWDEIARDLPALWREVGVRTAVESLPSLRATEQDLPARYVRRASVILSILAHSHVRSETEAAPDLPAVLENPWQDVARRLGKPEPLMWYEDLVLGNWRLTAPGAPIVTEHLDQLVPTPLGIETEKAFYLIQVEMHARATPLVGAVVRAQEAIDTADERQLEAELLRIVDVVREVHGEALLKIDPNPHSPTKVDPALWGGFIAPFAVSLKDHIPGPGGTAAPMFHVLDAFLGRGSYESSVGVEALHLREVGPRSFREFTAAIASGPGVEVIVRRGSRRLRGLLQTLIDIYAGPGGLLEAHRLKAYGFLETAFKVGRAVTISGLSGGFHERPWRKVHNELGLSRAERVRGPIHGFRGVLGARTVPSDADKACLVTLDVHDQGIVYRPGDRCLVWPRNSEARISATLRALGATGEEPIPLSPEWIEGLRHRADIDAAVLPLKQLLSFAALHPLQRVTARQLHELSGSESVWAVLWEHREDELDFAGAVSRLSGEGFDVGRLCEAGARLASILPPAPGRLYAIASPGGGSVVTSELKLLVEAVGDGVASSYLREGAPLGAEVAIEIVRPPRFHLPPDETVPLLIYAQPCGMASIRAMLRARASVRAAGRCKLIVEADTLATVPFAGELAALGEQGWLELEVAPVRDGGVPDAVRHDARLVDVPTAGEAPTLYIAGRDAFVRRTIGALNSVRCGLAAELVGQRRAMLQILPSHSPERRPGVLGAGLYDVSELAVHNDDQHGWWLALEGAVYDMTEFRELHPGGSHIVDGSAGTDASREYGAVLHYRDPEINAMLAMYKLGELRRLRFGEPEPAALRELYLDWVLALYTIVEMQNAFENDIRYLGCATTAQETAGELTPFKLMMFANSHRRFIEVYYKGVKLELIDQLAQRSAELLAQRLQRARNDDGAAAVLGRVEAQLAGLWREARQGSRRVGFWSDAAAVVEHIGSCDRRLLQELKRTVCDGVRQFERHESGLLAHGAELLDSLRRVALVIDAYHRELESIVPMARAT